MNLKAMQNCAVWVVLAMAIILAGCRGLLPPGDARPSDEPLYLAKLQYANGNYGLAEKYFRRAVEANDQSVDAWLGLAASYDRLRRFDLAERAYDAVIEKVGYTPTVLNNLGYHELLKGNIPKAREHFLAAAAKEPTNPNIQYNLDMLEDWAQSHGGAVQ